MTKTGYFISLFIAVAGIAAAVVAFALYGVSPTVSAATEQSKTSTPAQIAQTTTSAPAKPIFDTTLFRGKPVGGIGMRTDAVIVYAGDGSIWTDQKKLTAAVQDAVSGGANIIILDNETGTVSQYVQNVQWAKAAAPKALVGVYGCPFYAFFKTQKENQAINDSEMDFLKLLDLALPSSYTVFGIHSAKEFDLWSNCLSETIAECARVMPKKPVYPFLQVYYPPEAVSNQSELIQSPIFLQEVQACLSRADGAMIWAGPMPWDPKVAWYRDLSDAKLLTWETSATQPSGK